MSFESEKFLLNEIVEVTDYVANGSFASLKENVTYLDGDGYAVLVRLVDSNANWKGERVFVDERAYKFLSKSSLEEGDIVIANVGANAGSVFRVPALGKPATLGPNAVRVRPRSNYEHKLSSDFLYYYLVSPVGQSGLQSIITGSAQPKFNKTALRNLSLLVPSLHIQNSVASLMSSIDDRIALLRDTNSTLEAIAQALFKSWFVDFDPVRVKAEGGLPEGIDAATASLFPDAFEETELGVVPKGWIFRPVGDLLVPKRGKSITKTKCVEGDIPVVAGGLEPAYFHNQSNVSSPVVTISASGANAGFVRLYQQDIWASDCSFVSAEQTEAIYFWYAFLKFNQEKIYFMQQGAAQPHIYPSDLVRLHICSPQNDKLRVVFNNLVSPLFDRSGLNNTTIQTLSNLRDTLLPRLISGQLRISDAETELEKAIA